MIRQLLLVLVASLACVAASLAMVPPTSAASYVCEAKAEYTAENGYLERKGDTWIKLIGRFVFDEEAGILTRDKMEPQQMTVLQRGSSAQSVLASTQFQGAARYVSFSLRIETFKEPISFILDEDGSWVSGLCERIGK